MRLKVHYRFYEMTLHKDRETASPGQERIELHNTYHDTESTDICD